MSDRFLLCYHRGAGRDTKSCQILCFFMNADFVLCFSCFLCLSLARVRAEPAHCHVFSVPWILGGKILGFIWVNK